MGIMNNILLIEDDMSINKILAYELRKKGYLVDSLYDVHFKGYTPIIGHF